MSIGKPMKHFSPEPGWLIRQCHAAHIECMTNYSPRHFRLEHFSRPIPENEAREVFEKMDERFREWTGKSLTDHIHQQQRKVP